MAGGIVTRTRLRKWGFDISTVCEHCGNEDTPHHRVWVCSFSAAVRRQDASSDLISRAFRGASTPTFARLLPDRPSAPPPACSAISTRTVRVALEVGVVANEYVFVDGSATSPDWLSLSRAGWAYVVASADGQPIRGAFGCASAAFDQTAATAEQFAADHALAAAVGPIQLVADCQSVVSSAQRGHAFAIGPQHPQGDIWRDFHAARLVKLVSCCIKVKAHRSLGGLQGDDLMLAQGNALADRLARMGASLHDSVAVEAAELAAAWRELQVIVRVTGAALALWPPAALAYGPLSRVRAAGLRASQALAGRRGHQCSWRGDVWQCTVCHRTSASRRSRVACVSEHGLYRFLLADHNHHLAAVSYGTEGQFLLVFCWQCGTYVTQAARGISAVCPNGLSRAGKHALSRLRRGLRPHDAVEVSAPWPWRLAASAACSSEPQQLLPPTLPSAPLEPHPPCSASSSGLARRRIRGKQPPLHAFLSGS